MNDYDDDKPTLSGIPNFAPKKEPEKKPEPLAASDDVFEVLSPEENRAHTPRKPIDESKIVDVTAIDITPETHQGALLAHGKGRSPETGNESYFVFYIDQKGYTRQLWDNKLEGVMTTANPGAQQDIILHKERGEWRYESPALAKEQSSAQPVKDDKPVSLADIADMVNESAQPNGRKLSPAEIEKAKQILSNAGDRLGEPGETQTVTHQKMEARGGGQALGEGLSSLVKETVNLGGTVLGELGKGVGALAGSLRSKPGETRLEDAVVLPRLSEYRVNQLEGAEKSYLESVEQFWKVDKVAAVRKEIEERAEKQGVSVADVMDKMKPNGEFSDLHKKFTDAVQGSPHAANHRKSMDKALETWTRQFDRSQEELLNPDSQNNPNAGRVDGSKDRMLNAAKGIPAVGNETSQFEKLNEAIQKIMEKLKETLKEFMQSFRSNKGQSNDAPGPG